MELPIEPLADDQSQSDADRQRDTELRRYRQRLRCGQPGPPWLTPWQGSVLHDVLVSLSPAPVIRCDMPQAPDATRPLRRRDALLDEQPLR